MVRITCEMCGSNNLIKQDGEYVCQHCGTKYSVEEAKKLMVEITGTVDVSGSAVTVDNSSYVERYLQNARRARQKGDWQEVEKYYNLVEQNQPENIEAIFYSSYGKLRNTIVEDYSAKWDNEFSVLKKSISVLDDYFDMDNEEEQRQVIIDAMNDLSVLLKPQANGIVVGRISGTTFYDGVINRTRNLIDQINETLDNIITRYSKKGMNYDYLNQLKAKFIMSKNTSIRFIIFIILLCIFGFIGLIGLAYLYGYLTR